MPYNEEFLRIRRKYLEQYGDRAKAETFAFKEALDNKIVPYRDRRARYKRIWNGRGQSSIAGVLYFFMAVICVALFMPVVRDSLDIGASAVSSSSNGGLLSFIFTFWPVYVGIMLIIILVVVMRQ